MMLHFIYGPLQSIQGYWYTNLLVKDFLFVINILRKAHYVTKYCLQESLLKDSLGKHCHYMGHIYIFFYLFLLKDNPNNCDTRYCKSLVLSICQKY